MSIHFNDLWLTNELPSLCLSRKFTARSAAVIRAGGSLAQDHQPNHFISLMHGPPGGYGNSEKASSIACEHGGSGSGTMYIHIL